MKRDYSISLNGLIKNLEETISQSTNDMLLEQYFIKIPYLEDKNTESTIKCEWYITSLASINKEPEYTSDNLVNELNALIYFGSSEIEFTSFSDELNEVLNNTRVITEDKLNEIYEQVATELELNEFKIEEDSLIIPDSISIKLQSTLESKYNIYNTINKMINSETNLDKLKYLLQ